LGVTRRSLGRTQIVWALALSGLVACAGFSVRAAGTRLSAAPTSQASAAAPQSAPQGSNAGGAANQAPARGGVDTSKQTPGQPSAQHGPGPGSFGSGWLWWQDDAVKKEIGLRPNQATLIDHIYTRRLQEMAPVVQAYEVERAALNKMIADRLVDDTQLDFELTTKFLPLRSKLEASRYLMLYRISKVLDADQSAKLPAAQERHNQGRGRGGAPAPHSLDLLR
jgi:hypothetical protein